jgi:hypothetical protein
VEKLGQARLGDPVLGRKRRDSVDFGIKKVKCFDNFKRISTMSHVFGNIVSHI